MSSKIYDVLHVYFIYIFFYFFAVEGRLKDKIRSVLVNNVSVR